MCTCTLQYPPPQPPFKELCGGVLDLALHPSVGRFAADKASSYRPLLLVPYNEDDRQAIR